MDFFIGLKMLGGLALFLYGMNALSEGLGRLSGGRLENILEKITSNRLKGMALGALVTMLIQSSSATTVMVVGLVNSGLFKLTQSIGVIMGANVGTTFTSWILSLSAVDSSNFFVGLFKASSLAAVMAIVGITLVMKKGKQSSHFRGEVLVSFAILLYGMQIMSDAVKPLASSSHLADLFVLFENPLFGVLIGAAVTALVQSSSASVGILQALSASGAMHYGAAIPIILGQNIGTCVTAILSGIGAGRNAKRAAMVHLLFNVIGSLAFMLAFYSLNAVFHFHFMHEQVNAVGIAVVHSCFNLLASFSLLPFTEQLERLARFLVPGDGSEIGDQLVSNASDRKKFLVLDPRFLEKPSFAVEQAHHVLVRMAELTEEALNKATRMIFDSDPALFDQVEQLENRLDIYEDKLNTYLMQLSSRELSEEDTIQITMMMHCVNDYERISDHCINIAEALMRLQKQDRVFSATALGELDIYCQAIKDIMSKTNAVLPDFDSKAAVAVEPLEQLINQITDEITDRHIRRLQKGKCDVEAGLVLTDLVTGLERIADHCSNIAIRIVQIRRGVFDIHLYLHELRNEDPAFRGLYQLYSEQYNLKNAKQLGKALKTQVADSKDASDKKKRKRPKSKKAVAET